MNLAVDEIRSFQKHIWSFFALNRRNFPWRYVDDPYKVLVSEIMLQQTQTFRVQQKYEQFINAFGNIEALAHASLHDVLSHWQGLGYNRRAKYLYEIAQIVMRDYDGQLPQNSSKLEQLPGIGKYTAASVCAFAFNQPTVFIETNIRAVYIFLFFADREQVHDKEIVPLIDQTLDKQNPREWYYALMDYGVHIKKLYKNPSRKSAHYNKQSKFEGSDRQIRGMIIKILIQHKKIARAELLNLIQKEPQRTNTILHELIAEEIVSVLPDQTVILGVIRQELL